MPGRSAAAMSSAASEPLRGQYMFDCPEQSQTSPTSTSLNVTAVLPPETTSGVPACFGSAFIAGSLTSHLPESSAVAEASWPRNLTVTFSPGSAVPQTGTAMPCCSTMWSPKTGAALAAARACGPQASIAIPATHHSSRCILMCFPAS